MATHLGTHKFYLNNLQLSFGNCLTPRSRSPPLSHPLCVSLFSLCVSPSLLLLHSPNRKFSSFFVCLRIGNYLSFIGKWK